MRLPKSLWIFLFIVSLFGGYFLFQELTDDQVDEEQLLKTISGIEEMVTQVEEGNIQEGEEAFNQVHGFFHDIDPVLREKDPALAEQLWNAVLQIESQFGSYKPDIDQLKQAGNKTISLLQEAKEI
jgi:hypothetical protein